ncbi:hypothetical protein THRCLA_00045, partial [Thraustotheca clavata]
MTMEERLKQQIVALRQRQIILEGKLVNAMETERLDMATGIDMNGLGESQATLTLEICSGEGILDESMTIFGTGLGYVRASLIPCTVCKNASTVWTRRQRLRLPQWHETLRIHSILSLNATIYFEVLHAVRFGSDNVLGHATIPFEELLHQSTVEKWCDLTSPSRQSNGRIHVKVTLNYSTVRQIHHELHTLRQDKAVLESKLLSLKTQTQTPPIVSSYEYSDYTKIFASAHIDEAMKPNSKFFMDEHGVLRKKRSINTLVNQMIPCDEQTSSGSVYKKFKSSAIYDVGKYVVDWCYYLPSVLPTTPTIPTFYPTIMYQSATLYEKLQSK